MNIKQKIFRFIFLVTLIIGFTKVYYLLSFSVNFNFDD